MNMTNRRILLLALRLTMRLTNAVTKEMMRKCLILRNVMVFVQPYICTYDNGDNNLSTVVDLHVESDCKQFKKFENEADSDKEGQMTTSESHSKVRN